MFVHIAVGGKMQVVATTNSLPSGLGCCILNLWVISLLTRCLYRLYDGRKHVTVLDWLQSVSDKLVKACKLLLSNWSNTLHQLESDCVESTSLQSITLQLFRLHSSVKAIRAPVSFYSWMVVLQQLRHYLWKNFWISVPCVRFALCV